MPTGTRPAAPWHPSCGKGRGREVSHPEGRAWAPGGLRAHRGEIKRRCDGRRPQGQQSSRCGALARTELGAHGTCLRLPSQGKEYLCDSCEPGMETAKKGPSRDPAAKRACWPHIARCAAVLPAPTARHSPDCVTACDCVTVCVCVTACVCVCTCVRPGPRHPGGLSRSPGEGGSAGAVAGLSEVTGISLDRKIHSLDLLIANI